MLTDKLKTMFLPLKFKRAEIHAIIKRTDGSTVDLGVIAYKNITFWDQLKKLFGLNTLVLKDN